MLIYHNLYKEVYANQSDDSLDQDSKQSSSIATAAAAVSDNKTDKQKQKPTRTTILTRSNTNFLRSLGYRVRQYKKLKNE